MSKLFLPYDVFERHKKVGNLIHPEQTVVDIGGELNHLSQFCHPEKIVVANLTSGDVIISKDKLPFKKKSFDVACAIDVLEHIPKSQRKKFVEDLAGIASEKAILSFPVGSKKHLAYEKETQNWLKNKGESIDYLKDHIKFGLPDKEEMEGFIKGFKSELTYAGNIDINKILFRIFMFDPKIKYLRKVVYILKKLFYFATNEFFYLVLANKSYSSSVNRAYLIINTKQ